MKIFYVFLIMFFALSLPVSAKDMVQKNGTLLEGRISVYSDGLINFNSSGAEHSFLRNKPANYYEDFISYRANPFKFARTDAYVRVISVDRFTVVFTTRDEKVTLPRYRVSTLILNAD